ncbi:DUF4142 domain-containing protein [Mesorhizobium sp. BR1-1-9]|uniref:DUF4142 domain-containing protein n=1 Tax=unclassified Mesorhizobium TaxID=325217 RepID=UPI001CD10477|nr:MULTISPECIES: DUF4142 domain-containing protein [unclassified Mesorhizobium]MBZ9870261.1 DUF4142 domain-containing protein [Mesorhizobium sp. BR1-1-9]MBZ9942222.1 DUF4142 domain-containing protein [Mesorhizobium sp. BR1-1-13]
MNHRLLMTALSTCALLTFAASSYAADKAQEFVDKAAAGGMFEVESSKIAQGKAQDQAVKDFAQKMINDHGAANAKLETIAGEQKLKVPAETDAAHKSDLDALNTGKDSFDKSYVQMQRDAHVDAVKLFEGYAKDGDNAQLKTFAQETLPTLKMHQEMIEKIASGTNDKSSGTSSTTPAVSTSDTNNPAAPVPGANSFTEAQAKSRIQDAGFANVSALTKDDKGIWRGTAEKDGKQVTVALDFQGNVVAGAQ